MSCSKQHAGMIGIVNLNSLVSEVQEVLESTFWLIPAVIVGGCIALAICTLSLDGSLQQNALKNLTFIYAGGSDGARSVLSSIATAMMSVAGTVFSITVAVLTLASQQFGPRLITNFIRDWANQTTLGTFLGTFVYSLLILRTVTGKAGIVPHLSVTIAVALALISCCVLVFFINHLATSLRASYVIAIVASDLTTAARRLFPEQAGEGGPEGQDAATGVLRDAIPLRAEISGYLRIVKLERVVSLARRYELVVRIEVHPGDYIVSGDLLASVAPRESASSHALQELRRTFRCGSERSRIQDVGASLNQLAEIAVRALSSNQVPYTALQCLDRAASALVFIAQRRLPSSHRYDSSGRLRVIAHPYSYEAMLKTAFDPIRQNGASNTQIMQHMLQSIRRVAESNPPEPMLETLRRQAELTYEAAVKHAATESEAAALRDARDHVLSGAGKSAPVR